MSSPNNIVRKFCAEHQLRVVDSNKRAYKHTKSNINLFRFEDDYNKFLNEPIHFETETLYTVEISESELERIAEFEEQVFNNMKSQGHYQMFEVMMEQKQQEKYLRNKYPAVKKAYEQYSLMLKLAQSGEL
jgi:DNA repair ATPase RecN